MIENLSRHQIADFDFQINYKSGKLNVCFDLKGQEKGDEYHYESELPLDKTFIGDLLNDDMDIWYRIGENAIKNEYYNKASDYE